MPYPTPITTQICDRLDDYAVELERLAIPPEQRDLIATRLQEVRRLAWQADAARRRSHYLADTGSLSEWLTRDERRQQKRTA